VAQRTTESPEEWEVKWLVAAHLGGIPERRSGDGHDYNVHLETRVIALEVTKSAPKERNALWAAISKVHDKKCQYLDSGA
jgi:hypothetical protein